MTLRETIQGHILGPDKAFTGGSSAAITNYLYSYTGNTQNAKRGTGPE